MPVELAVQLRRRGIDAITVRDLDKLGDDDLIHLRRAAEQERVLCTYDKDYIRLAKQGIDIGVLYSFTAHIVTLAFWSTTWH